MTEGWVDHLTGPWGFAFAFAAGVLSFLSPCVLPLVPAYLAHMTGTAATAPGEAPPRAEAVRHAVAFVAGFAALFTFLGASVGLFAATLGADDAYLVRDHEDTIAKVGGVFLIVLGLNLTGIIRIPWLYRTYSLEALGGPAPAAVAVGGGAGGGSASIALGGRDSPGRLSQRAGASDTRGRPPHPGGFAGLQYLKSAGVGATFAAGWTPCIGPVLGAIFSLAVVSSDVAQGAYLLLVYSLGLGVPFIITGMAVVPVTSFLRRYRGWLPLVEVVSGVLVIFVGALIFLDELTIFNNFFDRYLDFFGLSEV